MYSWEDAFFILGLGRQHLMMGKPLFFKTVVALPTIGGNQTAGSDVTFYERQQLCRAAIFDDLKPRPAEFPPLAFNGNRNLAFMLRTTAALTATLAAKLEFIGLNLSRKGLPVGKDGAGSELLQPAPSCAITAQTQQILQCQSIHTGFASRKPPQGLEPDHERLFRSVKDGAGCHRMLFLTAPAQVQLPGTFPKFRMAAIRADKPFGPAKLEQIVEASLFVVEATIKFKLVFREIFKHIRPPCDDWRPA